MLGEHLGLRILQLFLRILVQADQLNFLKRIEKGRGESFSYEWHVDMDNGIFLPRQERRGGEKERWPGNSLNFARSFRVLDHAIRLPLANKKKLSTLSKFTNPRICK